MKNSNQLKNRIKRPRDPKGETTKTVFRTLFLCTILGVSAVAIWVGFWVYDVLAETPELRPNLVFPSGTTLILDQNGEVVYETGTSRHEWVSFNDISPVMIDAILAIEDSRFFDHHGVDWSRTIQAVRYTGQSIIAGGDSMQGGSTLTQQLINQTHLLDEETGQRVTTLDRKVQEVMLAIQLERVFSKEQIIEAYLNISPFGGNISGVQSAAQFYFGVDANQLTLAQAATLAGIVQAPSLHNPDRNAPQTQIRRDEVLNMMVRHGFIQPEQRDLASAVPVTDLLNYSVVNDDIERYRPFIYRVLEEAFERFGIEPTGGYRIYTTLDREAQGFVHDLLNTDDYFLWPNPDIQTAVAMIGNDGQIRAIAGRELGVELVERGFNLPVHMERQPGSSAKPIWAYGPAFEYLDWGTGTMINDELFGYDGSHPGSIIVRNWDHRFRGRVSVRNAMDQSWNVPAIKAYQAVVDLDDGETMERFVNNLGIPTPPNGFNQRYAIGGMEFGVSVLEMAGAYATFPNEGIFNEPFTISRIVAPDGTIIYGEDYHRSERVMNEGSAYMMNSILDTAASWQGTGGLAQVPGQWIAGKTGTTNFDDAILNAFPHIRTAQGVPDAWFVGYSMDYTVAVWTGYESVSDGSFLSGGPHGEQRIPQLIFATIMGRLNTAGERRPTRPSTVVERTVEWQSGERDGEACFPSTATPSSFMRTELFHAHAQPTCESDRFTGTGTGTEALAAPTDFNVTAGGGTTLNFTWEHDIGGHLSMSLEAATAALEAAVGATAGQTHITQALLDLNPGEAEARMIIDGINAGAQGNPIEYAVIATLANGSTRELVTSADESATYTLSRSDLVTIQSFHVIARLSNGGSSSEPSNSVSFNSDLIDESALNVTIPNMAGWPRDQVSQWARTNDVDYEFDEAYSDTIEVGHVITTNPTGSMTIDQTLRVTVSRGPEQELPGPGPDEPSDQGSDEPSDQEPDEPSDPDSALFDISPGLGDMIHVSRFNLDGSGRATRMFASVLERVRRNEF